MPEHLLHDLDVHPGREAERARPKPWVQAYRKVPVSSSLASTVSSANALISAGTAWNRAAATPALYA
jgi:hypothetical protein